MSRAVPFAEIVRSGFAEAIRTHPESVSGTTRDELALLRAIPAAIDKLDGVDGDAVRETGVHAVLGGGRPVGEIRALL